MRLMLLLMLPLLVLGVCLPAQAASDYEAKLARMVQVSGLREQMQGATDALGEVVADKLRQSSEDVPEQFIEVYVREFKIALNEDLDSYVADVKELYRGTLDESELDYLIEVYGDPRWRGIQGKLANILVSINRAGEEFGRRVADKALRRTQEQFQ